MLRPPQARPLRQLVRSECGQSLVLALVVMSAITISIFSLVSLTTGNETHFGRDRMVLRAFHVAEAGVNNGVAVVANQDPNDTLATTTRLPASGSYPLSIDGATGSYWLQKYAAGSSQCTATSGPSTTPCWLVNSTATSPDGKITKTIQQVVYWQTQTKDESAIYQYGLVVNNGGGACVNTHGNTTLTIKNVWIAGDFCPSGNIVLAPPAAHQGLVYIGGQYQGKNNTSIGTSSLPYAAADIVGGCTNQGNAEICSDSSNSNVYSDGPPSADPSTLVKPDLNPTAIYAEANWSTPTCSSGSFTFDNDSTMNGSVSGTTLLPGGSSFNCSVKDGSGTVVGSLAWNATTQALTISGTVFIDGNVTLSNSGTYTGNGTIYINGVVTGASNITICGPGNTTPTGYGCPGTWDATQGELGLVVVNPTNATTAFNRTGNGELDLTLFVNQGYADTGGTVVTGPVIADAATIGGSAGQVVPNAPPTGFPTTVTTSAAWVVLPGTWKQTQ